MAALVVHSQLQLSRYRRGMADFGAAAEPPHRLRRAAEWAELPDEVGGVMQSRASPMMWTGAGHTIPRLIHQIWDDETVETTCQTSAQSWERFCAVYGCRHTLWRRADIMGLSPFVNRQAYEGTRSPQMRADIARLEILNLHGGLYLDCDMIWAGRSAASDGFVDMLNTAQFALTASNDIRNASSTNARQPPLAVVFFTNRIMASVPQHEIVAHTIELVAANLAAHAENIKAAALAGSPPPPPRAFHMTGPHVLNIALQEVGDRTPLAIIPNRWVYPESLQNAADLVMFGHVKDRKAHAEGLVHSGSSWSSKAWLMQRALPNYFTRAAAHSTRHPLTDYKVQATEGNPEGKGAIAVFMHHNKAGGTGVKVALQQMYDANGTAPGLSHINVFSSSACAYSASAVARNRASVRSALCDAPLWSELKIPSCGRCHAPALASLREHKPSDPAQVSSAPTPKGPAHTGQTRRSADRFGDMPPPEARKHCQAAAAQGLCPLRQYRGKCCASCGAESCPRQAVKAARLEVVRDAAGAKGGSSDSWDVTPAGQSGDVASRKCQEFKVSGLCGDQRLRGYCCDTCGATSCGAPSVVVGDYVMGLCNVLPVDRPCGYYTMLREPRARIASSYLHCQYEPFDQLCMSHVLDAREVTFAQWVEHQGNYLLRQLAFDVSQSLSIEEQYELYARHARHRRFVRDLDATNAWLEPGVNLSSFDQSAGTQDTDVLQFKPNMLWLIAAARGDDSALEADVESFADLLESTFAVIGIVERYDESLQLFEATFGLPFVESAKHKSKQQAALQLHLHQGEDLRRRRGTQSALIREFDKHPELDAHIAGDLRLYERAVDIFDRQMVRHQQMVRDEQRAAGLQADGAETTASTDGVGASLLGWLSGAAAEPPPQGVPLQSVLQLEAEAFAGAPGVELVAPAQLTGGDADGAIAEEDATEVAPRAESPQAVEEVVGSEPTEDAAAALQLAEQLEATALGPGAS